MELLLLSVLVLFCELLVIRWVSTEIRIFAYFKNLPLMAVFLGLGLGFIWSERKWDLYRWSAFGLLFLSGLLTVAFGLSLTYLTFVNPDQFMMWGLQGSLSKENVVGLGQTIRSLLIMLSIFSLIAFIFIGLGQRTGRLFSQLQPIPAYSINVFGGLLGTILFSILSFMSTGPMVWLIVAGLMYFIIDRRAMSVALIFFGIAYGVYLEPMMTKRAYGNDVVKTVWSPYYRIDVVQKRFKDVSLGYNLYINYDSFQSIIDASPETMAKLPKPVQKIQLDLLTEPFRFHTDRPDQEVLILGSGSGSDVAAALRNGVKHIDAVEIDPAIAQIGRDIHPEKPYANPAVTLYVTDARNFLQTTPKKYDVIVFAALDSHAAFSSLSSLRMDNYVFTEEALKSAAALLKPGGIINVSFVVPGDWLWDRHGKTLATATNSKPTGYRSYADMNSGMLFGANGGIPPEKLPDFLKNRKLDEVNMDSPTGISTDDWPFLFLPKREIPTSYIMPIVAVLLLSAIPVALEFAKGARSVLNWQMFFLGMAFMMMEVRAMADISLLFGSTWVINSVIISAVMIVILIGNFIALRISDRWVSWLLGGVILSLLISTMVSSSSFIPLGPVMGGVAACTLYLFPLIFASTCFALLFKNTRQPSTALAFNLMGGVGGVCLEYVSMLVGIKALGWIGAGLYAIVLALNFLRKRSGEPDPAEAGSIQEANSAGGDAASGGTADADRKDRPAASA